MTFEEKVKAVIDKARGMDDSCLKYVTIREHIFSPGPGIAWQLFKTVEEREAFCKTPEYAEIQEIMSRAQKDLMR